MVAAHGADGQPARYGACALRRLQAKEGGYRHRPRQTEAGDSLGHTIGLFQPSDLPAVQRISLDEPSFPLPVRP